MEVPKLIVLLWCIYYSSASHHSHTIPVEGYETELQDLGEHVENHESPVRVIKITKTIAVKVPVPYPVKVIEKVPYPVHIVKPYPVPVPHIVKVPHPAQKHAHEAADAGSEGHHHGGGGDGHPSQAYEVQEKPSHDSDDNGYSYGPSIQNSYSGGGHAQNIEAFAEEYPSHEGYSEGSYDAPSHPHGSSGISDGESFESKSYEQAIQAFLNKNNPDNVHNHHSFH